MVTPSHRLQLNNISILLTEGSKYFTHALFPCSPVPTSILCDKDISPVSRASRIIVKRGLKLSLHNVYGCYMYHNLCMYKLGGTVHPETLTKGMLAKSPYIKLQI